ncbi:MAG: hypothetical protein K8S98_02555 [Planctomycetes bacterium]|nr:hypothetical protein [Planctomycetota bacterium]
MSMQANAMNVGLGSIVGALTALIATRPLQAPPITEKLRVHELELVDSAGKTIARFYERLGAPVLEYVSDRGGSSMLLTTNGDAGTLTLEGKNGIVAMDAGSTPSLSLLDGRKTKRFNVWADDGHVHVELNNAGGYHKFEMEHVDRQGLRITVGGSMETLPESRELNPIAELRTQDDNGALWLSLQSLRGFSKGVDDWNAHLSSDGEFTAGTTTSLFEGK